MAINVSNVQQVAEKIDLTILLLAKGEAENLRQLLPAIKDVINQLGIVSQIIVIDAASPLDDTESVCQDAQVVWLPQQGGNRYGDAIRTGIKASTGEFVVTMDSDGSHNPQFIQRLWENRINADVVIASAISREESPKIHGYWWL